MAAGTGQNWTANELGRWSAAPEKLNKKVRWIASETMVLNQFAAQDVKIGAGNGDTVTFTLYGDLPFDRNTRSNLGEFDPIDVKQHELRKITLEVTEYGLGGNYTGKAQTLSELGVKDKLIKALRRHYRKTVDQELYLEMRKCPAQYVATAADAATLTTEGPSVVSGDCGSNFNKYHLEHMVDFLNTHEGLDGASGPYKVVLGVRPRRGIMNDLTDIKKFTSTKDMRRGAVGEWENCRFYLENLMLKKTIGSGGAGGEAFVLGRDIAMRGRVKNMQIRSKTGNDFGRNPALAWYSLEGYKLVHETAKTGDFRQYRMVRFTSTESAQA